MIFQSRRSECPAPDELKSLYQPTVESSATPIETRPLAHVVSCAWCLGETNALLKLPLLATRYPADTLGPKRKKRGGKDSGGGDSTGGGGAPSGDGPTIGRSRKRAKETFEHLPKEL